MSDTTSDAKSHNESDTKSHTKSHYLKFCCCVPDTVAAQDKFWEKKSIDIAKI